MMNHKRIMIGIGTPTIQRTKLRPMIILLLYRDGDDRVRRTCSAAPSCPEQESQPKGHREGGVGALRDGFFDGDGERIPDFTHVVHSFVALLSRVAQGLPAFLAGIRNHALDVCLDLAER